MSIESSGRVAIETKFFGPTNHKGARIRVSTANGHKHWTSFDYGATCPHVVAVKGALEAWGWSGSNYRGASTKDGYVFVAV